LLCVGIDFKEILPRENLPSGVEKPQATQVGQIIQQLKVFFLTQFPAASFMIRDCQIVVAVQTVQRAAASYLD
jgi:hypothetical protein